MYQRHCYGLVTESQTWAEAEVSFILLCANARDSNPREKFGGGQSVPACHMSVQRTLGMVP